MTVAHRAARLWARAWLLPSGPGFLGRVAARLAALPFPPYYGRVALSEIYPKGFVCPGARIAHPDCRRGAHVFLDDGVLIYRDQAGGAVELGDHVRLSRDTILQTGQGGSITIGTGSYVQPRCQFSAYLGSIRIGRDVQIAPDVSFYPYNHGVKPDRPISAQPLESRGDIVVEDGVWIGVGATILDGVTIGEGAVVGAGAVVTSDVPPMAVVSGAPARVISHRDPAQRQMLRHAHHAALRAG